MYAHTNPQKNLPDSKHVILLLQGDFLQKKKKKIKEICTFNSLGVLNCKISLKTIISALLFLHFNTLYFRAIVDLAWQTFLTMAVCFVSKVILNILTCF